MSWPSQRCLPPAALLPAPLPFPLAAVCGRAQEGALAPQPGPRPEHLHLHASSRLFRVLKNNLIREEVGQ